jgi:DNA repair protein RadC
MTWKRDDVPSKKITRSYDAYEVMKNAISTLPYEEFHMIMINRGNLIIGTEKISEGGISGTVVDPKKLFKIALDNHASSLILVHNHPSGVTVPSDADRSITNKLVKSGEMIEIKILDHIIVGNTGYYSFADEGQI